VPPCSGPWSSEFPPEVTSKQGYNGGRPSGTCLQVLLHPSHALRMGTLQLASKARTACTTQRSPLVLRRNQAETPLELGRPRVMRERENSSAIGQKEALCGDKRRAIHTPHPTLPSSEDGWQRRLLPRSTALALAPKMTPTQSTPPLCSRRSSQTRHSSLPLESSASPE